MIATVIRAILCYVDQVIAALGRRFAFGKVAQSVRYESYGSLSHLRSREGACVRLACASMQLQVHGWVRHAAA
jgi:hypothetical protein